MRLAATLVFALMLSAIGAQAQVISERGFVEGRGLFYPDSTAIDSTRQVGEALAREEVFLKPAGWIQFAGGVDLRTDTHHQVNRQWELDWRDRTLLRPRLSLRRLTATITAGHFSMDLGKQFIRWGRADVTYPTDRFAPRDYLNVIDPELLAVTGVRPSLQLGNETIEAVWLPHLTPSRLPLVDQRWTFLPDSVAGLEVVDRGSVIRDDPQYGGRFRHTGGRFEGAFSYFEGMNHLPNVEARLVPAVLPPVPDETDVEGESEPIAPPSTPPSLEVRRVYPRIRMYGADAAIPTESFTLKLEAAYVTSPHREAEEYVLYVVEAEQQIGEWLLDAGYAGGSVTRGLPPDAGVSFAPDRGLARALIGRAAYTIDPRKTVTIEGALRQNLRGVYLKGEYSFALGQFWRVTVAGVGIHGRESDFIGRYEDNSYVTTALRFSF